MNTSNTNSGGWEDSYMRSSICGTSKSNTSGRFMGAIPSALRNALKSVTKYTDNTGNSSTASSAVTATTDYIFLLSEYEVFGSCTYANSNEASRQQQYAYYSAGNSKIKYQHNSTGSSALWWLRSPYRSNSTGSVGCGHRRQRQQQLRVLFARRRPGLLRIIPAFILAPSMGARIRTR